MSRRAGEPRPEPRPEPECVSRRDVITRLRREGFSPTQAQILWEEGWWEEILGGDGRV